jgi:hypothetical protein
VEWVDFFNKQTISSVFKLLPLFVSFKIISYILIFFNNKITNNKFDFVNKMNGDEKVGNNLRNRVICRNMKLKRIR